MSQEHAHGHSHGPGGHHHHGAATKNITLAFALNFCFAIIELIGGLWTNSIAILSDSLHDFGDSLSLGVALYLQKYSERKPDKRYSYGYKRFSLLGAVFISVVLLVGSVIIISECVERIITPQEPNVAGMFWLAILGLTVNGLAVLRVRKGSSLNERAISLHLMEDVLGWAAVLVGSIVMYFVHVPVLDPLMSVGISIWVIYNVFRNLKASLGVFMQGVPAGFDIKALTADIDSVEHVKSIHDLHLWTLDGENHVLSLHVVTDDSLTDEQRSQLKGTIRELAEKHGVGHTTQELETTSEACCEADCGIK